MNSTHRRHRFGSHPAAEPDLVTRLENLPPMHVASVRAVGFAPEIDAWNRLQAWAAPRGLLDDLEHHPVFGFNNPPPARGRREHGYEFWIRVAPATPPHPAIELKDFPGGLFLVTTCRLVGDPAGEIGEVWTKLWQSTRTSPYRWRGTHELEKPHDPTAPLDDYVVDLYLPVRPVLDESNEPFS